MFLCRFTEESGGTEYQKKNEPIAMKIVAVSKKDKTSTYFFEVADII